jgi:protein phosphatase 1G
VAVVHGNKLYVANAGDSRCILSRGKDTIPMTEDHKPTNPEEERRIKAAGGFVSEGRINGGLNLSRAIGDMNYKTVCSSADYNCERSGIMPFFAKACMLATFTY